MTTITGVHPYADAFPPASDEELDALTESVASVGLIHPIVVTPDGLVLDGRNRLVACERAGVEPQCVVREGSDDDYKEFVIGVNTTGRRESMTVQIAAAATALILGTEKRINGQWRRSSLGEDPNLTQAKWKLALSQCGLVLDVLGPDALIQVRDGRSTLNAVYAAAQKAVREQEERRQREAEEAAAEAQAKEFIEANAPDLAAEVGGLAIHTYTEAFAVWEKRNREEAEARRREEAMRIAARAEVLSAWGKACDGLLAALSYAAASTPPADTDRYPTVDVFIERYNKLGKHITEWENNK